MQKRPKTPRGKTSSVGRKHWPSLIHNMFSNNTKTVTIEIGHINCPECIPCHFSGNVIVWGALARKLLDCIIMYKPSKYGWFMTLLYQRCFGRESIWNGFVAYLSRATGKQMVAASFACLMCQEVFRATLADTNLLKWMWFDMFGKSGTSGFFGFYWFFCR